MGNWSSQKLLRDVSACTVCAKHLPLWPRPIISISKKSKIIIIGQAPGTKVHASGKPRDDPSGVQLRKWLGVDEKQFYDPDNFGIMPMGFCYPWKMDKGGDAPPRPECAPLRHERLLEYMSDHQLILLVGMYAQKYYLQQQKKKTLTETVHAYEEYLPSYFPLPHPSRRSNIWQKKNPWYEKEVLPVLQAKVQEILHT